MACTGHCNDCAGHGGYIPGVAPYAWTNDPITTSDPVEEDDYNEMGIAIVQETTRRNSTFGSAPSAGFPGTLKTSSDIIYALDYREVRDHIVALARKWSAGVSYNPTAAYGGYGALAAGQQIQDESTEEFRTKINELKAECVCDCAYACTCNCNHCPCDCNHVCECDCNYSDKRLKEEICYL
jgi:hypothetical protein